MPTRPAGIQASPHKGYMRRGRRDYQPYFPYEEQGLLDTIPAHEGLLGRLDGVPRAG